MADDLPSMDEVRLDDVKVEDTSKDSVKPRAARTTAIKVTAGLLAKVASGFCGADLKITGIMPHESLSQLCDALVGNVVTRRLDLEGCGVGDRGCIFIRDLLLKNRTIETLDLKLNQISDAGVKLLADAMQKSASIQMLFLNDNDVTDLGVQHLLAALQNGCGCFVSLRGCCRVSPAMLQELEDFVEGTTVQSKPVIPDRDSKEKKRDADPEKSDKIKTTQPEQVKVATPKVVAPVSPKRANVVVVAKFSDFQVQDESHAFKVSATPITIKKTKRRAAEMSTCAAVVESVMETVPTTPTQNPDECDWMYNSKASKRPNPADAAVASQTFRVHEFVRPFKYYITDYDYIEIEDSKGSRIQHTWAASWSRLRSVVCDRLNAAIVQHSARAVFSSERTAILYGCQVLLEDYMRGSANHVIRQKPRPISDESWQKAALASVHCILDVCMSSTQELISMHRFQWEAVKWGLSDRGVALSKCIGCPFDVSVDLLAADGSIRRTLSV